MNIKIVLSIPLTIVVVFIGYGLAQQFEGSSCSMHDGRKGTCKNVDHCESIKQGLRHGQLKLQNIVGCSFMGSVQIACCADETTESNPNQPPVKPPPTNDFVFEVPTDLARLNVNRPKTTTERLIPSSPWLHGYSTPSAPNRNTNGQFIEITTQKPTRATTINPFWNEWSANKPTNFGQNEIDRNSAHAHDSNEMFRQTTPKSLIRTTTPALESWMLDILNEIGSTTTPRSQFNQNNHEDYTAPNVVGEMPAWLHDVFHQLSTTTTRTNIRFENDNTKQSPFGGGNGGSGNSNGDLHRPKQNSNDNDSKDNRTPDPFTHTRYSKGRKAEAACELYSSLVPNSTVVWKIIGGSSADVGEFPWMAAIGYSQDNSSFDCGGTIISEYYILTAAHCTPTRRPPVKIRLGKVNLLTNDDEQIPVDLNVQEFMRHPEYKAGPKKNDIALIRVAERIKFTDNIRPACLQTNLNDVLPNTELYVTGWGSTSAERTVRPNELLKTNITSMPLSACNTTLLEYNRQVNHPSLRNGISESQLCAYDPDARNDACQGDSGGPLQTFALPAMGTVIGIVSFGISCGTPLPGVYTRVAYYLDWIESIVWPNSFNDV